MSDLQLRAFHAVAAEGGFTRGAAALRRTQPAVSAQVKALEGRYGVKLFERGARGIALTELGQRLFEITRRMHALEEEAELVLRSTRRSAALRIAADAPYSLSPLLATYCQQNPDVRVSVGMANAEAIVAQLLAGEVDAAILVRALADPRFAVVPYARHRLVAIVGAGHPWARRSSVAARDFEGRPMVARDARFSLTSQVFERALRERGVRPDVTLRVDSRENLREVVASGVAFGVSAEPDAIADRRLRRLRLRDLDLSIADYLVCLAERRADAPIGALLRLAGPAPT